MKKFLLSAAIIGSFVSANAQGPWIADSVSTGPQYVNRIYYSLENGQVGSVPYSTRDWFIDVSAQQTVSIRINGGFNAALYKYTAGDTAAWSTLDTAGLGSGTNFLRVRDTEDSYFPSAFEIGATGHPNYGWGEYNSVTHVVVGNKLYIFKTVGGLWKKVWIQRHTVSSQFIIKVANLDGTGEEILTIAKAGITDKSFIHYSFATGTVYNDEPVIDSYDLIFTKMVGLYNTTPNQAVTGVETNHGVLTAKAQGLPANNADVNDYTLEETLNGIGSAWKNLNSSFQWFAYDSLSYFVQDVPGNIWQIRFTGFGGGSTGKYKFEKRKIAYASINENNETVGAWNVFPNPAADFVSIVFNSNVADNATFNLLDLNGRTVMSENFSANTGINQFSIDLASKNLPAGIYVATLRAGNVLKTTKLIVQ